MVCTFCNDTRATELDASLHQPRPGISWQGLQIQAQQCGFCKVIWKFLQQQLKTPVDRIRYSSWRGVLQHPISPDSWSDCEYHVRAIHELSGRDITDISKHKFLNTGSPEAAAWVSKQIAKCIQENPRNVCRRPGLGYLPRRVLRLGSPKSAEPADFDTWLQSDVNLHVTDDRQSGEYATLSHCWGSIQPTRLLKDNYESSQERLLFPALPRTFQDAIVFTRRLGLPFLWIDSLCIIQDSHEDWLEQSAKMAHIYEASSITLAAADSEDSRGGLFREPSVVDKGFVTDGNSQVPLDASANTLSSLASIMADNTSPNPLIIIKKAFTAHGFPTRTDFDRFHLLTRAWVYQERFLSHRVVHFHSERLLFECNEHTACSCGCQYIPGTRDPLARPPKQIHGMILEATRGADNGFSWATLVIGYTRLTLTFDTDRLIAIAGLAKQFRRSLGNQNYMAGLWEESIIAGMTWATRRPAHRATRVAAAPSWSWLAVPGVIVYPQMWTDFPISDEHAPQLEAVDFTHDRDREFTMLWGGSVTLHGRLVPAKLRIVMFNGKRHVGVVRLEPFRWTPIALDFEPDYLERPEDWRMIEPTTAASPSTPSTGHSQQEALIEYEGDNFEELYNYSDLKHPSIAVQLKSDVYCLSMGSRAQNSGTYIVFIVLWRKGEEHVRLGLGSIREKETFLTSDIETCSVKIV